MIATDIAHIVTHYVNQKGDTISPKKLQKLLYYVEAWNLVHLNTPLIEEDFEAWVHGPVLPSLYDEFDTPDDLVNAIIVKNKITDEQIELIYSVLDKYGSMTSFQLELLSHNETPWIEAREGVPPHQPCNNIIPKPKIKAFYSSLIAD
jgi:uncharacterized phage-associated protein